MVHAQFVSPKGGAMDFTAQHGFDGINLTVYVPRDLKDAMQALSTKCAVRHNGYVSVTADTPKRKRSTGPGSQAAHLHGHLQQIATYTGYTMGEIKEAMKADLPDWPSKSIAVGERVRRVYMSEADASSELESKAIEWTHVRAAEMGIVLIEDVREGK